MWEEDESRSNKRQCITPSGDTWQRKMGTELAEVAILFLTRIQ
jgi:hypothetical protein